MADKHVRRFTREQLADWCRLDGSVPVHPIGFGADWEAWESVVPADDGCCYRVQWKRYPVDAGRVDLPDEDRLWPQVVPVRTPGWRTQWVVRDDLPQREDLSDERLMQGLVMELSDRQRQILRRLLDGEES